MWVARATVLSGVSVSASLPPRDFVALCNRRARRADLLAERFPESAEPLEFYGAIASFQATAAAPRDLLAVAISDGPDLLRELARTMDESDCLSAVNAYRTGADRSSPRSFFGRALLQAQVAAERFPDHSGAKHLERCPRCGHPPQVGVLVPEGDGRALELVCSLCFANWPFPRERCPACRDGSEANLVYYEAAEIDHLQVRACDACRTYLHLVRMDKAPDAIPDADEIAALPLDVWARERGYRKVVPNLIGI